MLKTQDLILQSGSADDGIAMYQNLWRHDDVFRYMFTRASSTEATACERTAAYAQMHRQVDTEFFVYEKVSGQPIGIAGIKELRPGEFTVTDIAIGPAFTGRGYGKQILLALIDLAFSERGNAQLYYDCFEENVISRRLAESCGFTYDHSEQAELLKDGEPVTLVYYKLGK